ncbi:MAG TPA: histidine kinase dimerization/phospho-acceptor domain-containing protein [Candidatus Dormibacteraeota bacterium]|nr:histidine kinase dimerization/phospho-acceptor domain-containing protein [Candidatus Dormibacteraeota bacterium]
MRLSLSKSLLCIACFFFGIEIVAGIVLRASHTLAMLGDFFPVIFIMLALVGFHQNWIRSQGLLRAFWRLNGIGFAILLLSEFYVAYYDFRYGQQPDNSIPGDALFLMALIPVLGALAISPQSHPNSQRLRFHRLDFILLASWWLCLFVYFAVPWQYVVRDMVIYNRVVYLLLLVEHCAVVLICGLYWRQSAPPWKKFYHHLFVAFLLFAIGSLLTSIAFEKQIYYSGSLFDLPWNASLLWTIVAIHAGKDLRSSEQSTEAYKGLWTARFAMFALFSFPALSIWGYLYNHAPAAIADFRLRLAFGAMLPLGALAFFKIRLLDHELLRLLHLTAASVQSLKSVQAKLSQSQKMAALGRLAAGAGHEISNPLTAILGYAELLEDNPTLSAEERQHVKRIEQQVHRAQAAVLSMRHLDRSPNPASAAPVQKNSSN